MKKLFTLVALLAMALGANAKLVVDTEFDYKDVGVWTEKGGWASEAAASRLSIDDNCLHFHSEEAVDPYYDVQFQAFGVKPLNPDAEYTIEFRIKGSVAQDIHVSFSGCATPGTVPVTTDWQTVTFKSTNNPNDQWWADTGMLLIQCGDYVGDWWISNVKITHEEEDGIVEEYEELLTNGNAEKSWKDLGLDGVKFNDQTKNFKVCAWGKVKGVNTTTRDGKEVWDPFPATIEAEEGNPSNHVFVVHAAFADSEEGSAWDNQFWIEGPKAMKAGRKYKVSFRYKANVTEDTGVETQIHNQNPSSYKTSTGLGKLTFKKDWQTYEDTFIATDDHANGWSFAFNLNSDKIIATDFFFDDLSWEVVKLEEGYFVTACTDGEPNLDQVKKFDEAYGEYTATIGTAEAPVTDIMISTVLGNTSAFKGSTIKPKTVVLDKEVDFEDATSTTGLIKLPGKGVWSITLVPGDGRIEIKQVSGELYEKINPNPTNIVVKAKERDDLKDDDHPEGTGQTWDNQFFIVANRALKAGEVTVVQFEYKASTAAKVTTQSHEMPGNYIHYAAINDVNCTTEWQQFEVTFTIPAECNGDAVKDEGSEEVKFYKNFQTIAFNMAEIKEACDYEIKNVVWKLEGDTESLIDQTGSKNFFVKVVGDAAVSQYGGEAGIKNVVSKSNVSNTTFNIAGQRVAKDFKGLVIKNGSKYIVK